MPKPKNVSPVQPESALAEKPKPELSPAQKQGLLRIQERLSAKNKLKFHKNSASGKIEVAGDRSGMAILQAMEATGSADQDAAMRLVGQAISAQPNSEDLLNTNAAVALMQGIGPQDELEGMLACQMVAVHNLSMEYSRRVMNSPNLSTDGANSLIARTTKLMNVFTRQMEALQRHRTKGQQKIVVQHVQVSEGGQAIIGDIHQGGGERG